MNNTTPYKAPSFSLTDMDGKVHSLKEYNGSWVVLYFYPKDDTPGCTVEACGFRDIQDTLLAKRVVVLGVSRDDGASHRNFYIKHSLDFTLLSDPDHKVMDAYGVWGKKMFGQEGVLRKTFVINPAGQVVKVYGRVTPVGHAGQILADLEKLQAI
ncbi:MAG TPA: peroxiredoxin [Candidatus Saccharimonas sp.]|jgi:peroxiredoxin Q/BCP|nr:peroxiredoxin [Candidatus Saccharimonas sp.]